MIPMSVRELREKAPLPLEVHVSGLCFRRLQGMWSVLLQRLPGDQEFVQGCRDGCGGCLRAYETFQDGVRRIFRAELGLVVSFHGVHEFYEIPWKSGVIPGIRFLCLYEAQVGSALLSGDSGWFMKESVEQMSGDEFIPGMKSKVLDWFDELQLRGCAG